MVSQTHKHTHKNGQNRQWIFIKFKLSCAIHNFLHNKTKQITHIMYRWLVEDATYKMW